MNAKGLWQEIHSGEMSIGRPEKTERNNSSKGRRGMVSQWKLCCLINKEFGALLFDSWYGAEDRHEGDGVCVCVFVRMSVGDLSIKL